MFREKIKGKMNETGMNVRALANETHILASTISSFLVGNRAISNDNLELILKTLNLTLVPKKNFIYKRPEKVVEDVSVEAENEAV